MGPWGYMAPCLLNKTPVAFGKPGSMVNCSHQGSVLSNVGTTKYLSRFKTKTKKNHEQEERLDS